MSFSSLLPILIILCGAYMLIRLRFFTLLCPHRIIRGLRGALSDGRARSNLALALAGTLGVGNIVGVAVGISVGGCGALFWIVLSSAFSSVIKYSEATLSADLGNSGYGFMHVLEHTFPRRGRRMGALYAALCLFLSFILGGALQSSAVYGTSGLMEGGELISSTVFALLVALVVLRGARAIRSFTLRVIPASVALYVILCIFVIIKNAYMLPSVLSEVFRSAFEVEGAIGGALGVLLSRPVSEGFSRGLLSNEAGAGTSSLATSDGVAAPTAAGLLGFSEVLFDTLLLCTLSGLAILVSVKDPTAYPSGACLVRESIGAAFGAPSSVLLTLLIFVFAFSTSVCWYYYGVRCFGYLFGRGEGIYAALFLLSVALLPLVGEGWLVSASDVLLLCLSVLTLLCIVKSSDRIRELSELSGLLPFTRR